MADHALFSPSACDRLLVCTKSLEMGQKYKKEEKPSPYALEGTAAHALLERAIMLETRPSELEPDNPAAQDVDVVFDYLHDALNDPDAEVQPEVRVKLNDNCWGTADVVILRSDGIEVVDMKFGRGVAVEVPSIQLELYAEAARREKFSSCNETLEIKTTVVQPRLPHEDGPIRSKSYTAGDLNYKVLEYEKVMADILAGKTEFNPGEKQCRWCPAKTDCRAHAEYCFAQAGCYFEDLDGKPGVFVPTKDELSLDEKIAVHEASGLIQGLLAAVAEDLEQMIFAGQEVPGYKLVAGRSTRKWSQEEADVIKVLTEQCKLKLADIAPPKLLGPAPIEKLIDVKSRNGQKKFDILQSIIVKPEGKPTIVKASDKRPALTSGFKNIENVDPLN